MSARRSSSMRMLMVRVRATLAVAAMGLLPLRRSGRDVDVSTLALRIHVVHTSCINPNAGPSCCCLSRLCAGGIRGRRGRLTADKRGGPGAECFVLEGRHHEEGKVH